MSGGPACSCTERTRPLPDRYWYIVQYHHHFSAFSGYHMTYSDYSKVRCASCGISWRTKAAYVEELAHDD